MEKLLTNLLCAICTALSVDGATSKQSRDYRAPVSSESFGH